MVVLGSPWAEEKEVLEVSGLLPIFWSTNQIVECAGLVVGLLADPGVKKNAG